MIRSLVRALLAPLLLVVGAGCGVGPTAPPHQADDPQLEPNPPALAQDAATGLVAIVAHLPEAAAAAARIELVVTGTTTSDPRTEHLLYRGSPTQEFRLAAGRNRLFLLKGYDASDALIYTGAAQTDIRAGEQLDLKIRLWPLGQPTPLLFSGIGPRFSQRFLLKAHIPYVMRIRYIERIKIDLLDATSGDLAAAILAEEGISTETVRTNRIVHLCSARDVFLRISETDKLWRLDIEGY